jgi:hypothetical protein
VQRSRHPRAALSPSTHPPLPHRRLPNPTLARPCFFHVAPPPLELPRAPPASPAPACARSTSLGFKARPAAAPRPAYPAQQLLLHCNLLPRAQSLTGPLPQSLATVDSHPHHLRTPIQCISSTATTHRSSLSKPISISSTRTAGPQRRRSSCSAARSASPSTHRYRAPQPQPGGPTAPRHLPEAILLLLHRLPPPQPEEHHAAIAACESPKSTSPSTTTFRPASDQIGYGKSIPALLRSSCAPPPSLFVGPSPRTRARRHSRHHPSSPAMLRRCSSSTSPTIVTSSSCRPRSTCSSPAKPSPPARTRRPEPPVAVASYQGPFCKYLFYSRVPCARNRGPPC